MIAGTVFRSSRNLMEIKEERFVKSLENRINYYRHCMAWTFFMGFLAGVCIFCGETGFLISESPGLSPKVINMFFCFLIAITGITAGSAYRRRVRFLKDCRDKIQLEFSNRQFFPKPVREGIITEMQVLFGILFVLSAVICCIHYPVPKLPAFLDSDLIRMIPIMGFVGLCWISVCPERKNPFIRVNSIQNFIEGQKIHISLRHSRPKIYPAYTMKGSELSKSSISQLRTNQSMQP